MSGLTVTFLGAGGSAGTPQIGGADGSGDWGECDPTEPKNRRSRPSVVIEAAGKRLLVDTGPDLHRQLTDHRIPNIHAILYTHAHADHIAGLDEVRILNRLIDAPMPGFATAETWADLRERFNYAFRPWTGPAFFRPVFNPAVVAPGETHEIIGLPVRMIHQDHGYTKTLGLRINNFAYCTDVVRLDETALAALEGVGVLVVDCFTRHDPHPTHANLAQIFAWVDRLKPARTILTHMGPSMDYTWLRENLPPGIEPAYDGLILHSEFP